MHGNILISCIKIILIQTVYQVVSSETICQQCITDVQNCRKISGIFTVTRLSKGYNHIVEIPAGTCNINITEYQPSKNYLAIKEKDGNWIVNGQSKIDAPGTYRGVGTTFMYDRNSVTCKGECIHGQGPTAHAVIAQVLYSENNQGILYEFTLPPGIQYTSPTKIVRNTSQNHRRRHNRLNHRNRARSRSSKNHRRNPKYGKDNLHSIRESDTQSDVDDIYNYQSSQTYGSHTLGGRGLSYTSYRSQDDRRQRRPQYFQRPRFVSPYGTSDIYRSRYNQQALRSGQTYSRTVNERTSNNVPLQYPDQNRRNSLSEVVRYSWKISGFSECSQTCGGGKMTTNVVCVLSSTNVVVTNNNCADQSKPQIQQLDCNTSPCPAGWENGQWSSCSVTCGHGVQRRRVECKRRLSERVQLSVSASLCSSEVKPAIIQQCHNGPCTRWQIGEWSQCSVKCGMGVRERRINCINNNGNTVLKSLCSQQEPVSSESCDMGSCDYHWFVSSWSTECSSTCGTSVVTRKVHCATNTGKNITESFCDYNKKPFAQKQCPSNPDCGNKWFTGPWSLCSSSCGTGVKTREVSCIGRDGSDRMRILPEQSCDVSIKPAERDTCEQTTCGSQWYMTDWSQCSVSCGNGTKARYVNCLTQYKEPSTECDTLTRPTDVEHCFKRDCHTNIPVKDPTCKNRYSNCRVVVQARLCKYGYYKNICCEECYYDNQKSLNKS